MDVCERAKEIAAQLQAAAQLQNEAGTPRVGFILGSGWGGAAHLEEERAVAFSSLEGMPACTVAGHAGNFLFGKAGGNSAVISQGRLHLYEGHAAATAVLPVAVLYELGVRTVVLTNAAGGIDPAMQPSELMLLRDHINLTGQNPLVGRAGSQIFADMTQLYDAELRQTVASACKALSIPCREGVYIQVTGPSYETPAEIRAFRALGADAVGMSTAAEAVYARYLGMRVAGVSFLSNMAAGLAPGGIGHDEVLERSERSRASLAALLYAFAERL